MIDYTISTCGVYMIEHMGSGKIYIGSSRNVGQRWYKHFKYPSSNSCTKLRNAILKHGVESFTAALIEATTEEDLIDREQYYLDTLQPFDDVGYNIRRTAGSNIGITHTTETKAKWSELKRGDKNPMWGRRGRSERKKASDFARRGQTRTPEQRDRMGKHLAVSVTAISKDGTIYKTYTSQADAVKDVNGDPTALWKCLTRQPNFKTHKGFRWVYTSELTDVSLKPNSL